MKRIFDGTTAVAAALSACLASVGLAQEAAPQPEPPPAAADAPDPDAANADAPDAAAPDPDAAESNPFLVENETITDDDLLWLKKNQIEFMNHVNSAKISPVVKRGIAVMVGELSLKANRKRLSEIRGGIERKVIARAGALQRRSLQKRQFREYVMEQLVESIAGDPDDPEDEGLLDGNLEVRLNAMILLNELEMERGGGNGQSTEFYTPVYKTFIDVLTDREQHDAVRIWAAKGLKRVLAEGRADNRQRNEIAQTIIAELQNAENHDWIEHRLVQALGWTGLDRFGAGPPFVIDALVDVLTDAGRDPLVRTEAAKQLARTRPVEDTNYSLLAWLTVKLAKEMALQQRKSPSQAAWRVCYLNTYLAFLPKDAAEARTREAGFVTRAAGGTHEEVVRSALDQIKPLVNHVLAGKEQISDEMVQGLDDWLDSNEPSNYSPAPGLDALNVKRVAVGGGQADPEPAAGPAS